ncbi:hypothetical protein JCM19238_3772 [Vibrio ponticus]|nr:hypothetical protein JCM19238_3772 [Vibrio ponticus]
MVGIASLNEIKARKEGDQNSLVTRMLVLFAKELVVKRAV